MGTDQGSSRSAIGGRSLCYMLLYPLTTNQFVRRALGGCPELIVHVGGLPKKGEEVEIGSSQVWTDAHGEATGTLIDVSPISEKKVGNNLLGRAINSFYTGHSSVPSMPRAE
jgi:hypothetical protein